jgi:hypothetical protein
VLARFTELEDERAAINTELAGLAKTDPQAGDPALLDALPQLGDLLAEAPARRQQQLYQAFDLQALYNKNLHQVTIHVTITDTTPRALAAIISNAGDGPQASPAGPRPHRFFGFGPSPYVGKIRHDHGKHPIQPEWPTMMWRSVVDGRRLVTQGRPRRCRPGQCGEGHNP